MASWSKAKVIATFRKMRESGKRISYGHINRTWPNLATAAKRHFGTYRAAVIAAGFDYDRDIRQQHHWSKPIIIQEIRRRFRHKEDLSAGSTSRNAKPLYLASVTHFGSYRNAVLAAGIDYDAKIMRPKGWKWPEKRVLTEIKRQHQAGKDLSYNGMRRRCEPLVFAAARRFGSYANALKAAGIEPASVRAVRRWDKDRVAKALRRLNKAGKDISATALKLSNASLYAGARKHFPSFAAALAAAGTDISKVRRIETWTKERVLGELGQLRRSGKSLAILDVRRMQHKLVDAALRHFGSYAAAIKALGINYERDVLSIRVWTRQAVLEAIKTREAQGQSLQHSVVRKQDPGLLVAAQRRWGGWFRAVKAAGIDYDKILNRWDKPKVLAALRKLAATGQDMKREAVRHVAYGLVQAAQKHFGGYYDALTKAGIEPPKTSGGKTGVTAGAAHHWNKETILQTLTELNREGKVDLRYRPMKASHHSLFWAAKELFGSYVAAVVAAGINYDQVVRQQLKRTATRSDSP